MSITRKLLKGMGLTDEQQDTILEAHTETVSEIKAERDRYKLDAERLPEVQRQLDDLKAAGDGGFKEKYEAVKKEYDDYKADQAAKDVRQAKEKAYRAILQEVGISDKRLDKVLQLCDVDGVELDDHGAIKDARKLSESLKAEWADFIVTESVQGAQTANPPANNGTTTMSREQIMSIKDAGERQKAIAENRALFNF